MEKKMNITLDPESFPILSTYTHEALVDTIYKLLEFHKMEATEKNIYSLLTQLFSDLQHEYALREAE